MNETEKTNKKTHLSRNVIWMCLGAVAYVVFHLGNELTDYLQADAIRYDHVVMRSLGILGWCVVLFVLIKHIKNDRKR